MTNHIIEEHAPAKVNLYLRICGRRDDGYHLLDSAVVFTDFGDHISLIPASADSLTITGTFAAALSPRQDDDSDTNLCLRALVAFRAAGGQIAPMAITLEKHIPVGAGLGGGSADAGAVLRALNRHANKKLAPAQLVQLASMLGADVPACLMSKSLRMTSIGDVITPLPLLVNKSARVPDAILLVTPLIPLATQDVFRLKSATGQNATGQNATGQNATGRGPAGDISGLDTVTLAELGNDLTENAITLVPEIASLLPLLSHQTGCNIAAMSGSGASCFALFDSMTACKNAERVIQHYGLWAQATHII